MQATGIDPWLLDTQYRMHPAIANFPNDLFYNGELKSGVKAAERPAPTGKFYTHMHCPLQSFEIIMNSIFKWRVYGGRAHQHQTVRTCFSPGKPYPLPVKRIVHGHEPGSLRAHCCQPVAKSKGDINNKLSSATSLSFQYLCIYIMHTVAILGRWLVKIVNSFLKSVDRMTARPSVL